MSARMLFFLVPSLLVARLQSADLGLTGRRQAADTSCESDSTLAIILGDWVVTDSAGGIPLGSNRIDRSLGGCLVTEAWQDPDGSKAYGIFYYHTSERRWKLVLVDESALAPGGVKERRLVATLAEGGFRFLGKVLGAPNTVLDRLTFVPLGDGRVREIVERSRDGGETWRKGFDGFYSRRTLPGMTGPRSQPDPSCSDDPALHQLDFWIGSWSVIDSSGSQVGTNRIDRILGGCALVENWKDSAGEEGKSLFYYVNAQKQWKQVWVTPEAMMPGGMKEKRLVAQFPDGGVRFQGAIATPRGLILDRTTLTPLAHGRVRQLIEISRDGGKTWRSGFDATYVPIIDDPSAVRPEDQGVRHRRPRGERLRGPSERVSGGGGPAGHDLRATAAPRGSAAPRAAEGRRRGTRASTGAKD